MQVKTCKRCNKLFQYVTGRVVCPKCRKREEELFGEVKDYLRDHKGASMEEVSEATGASLGLIQTFLREGRLEVTADSPIAIECEQCGTKIRTGRFCDKCRNTLAHGLGNAAKSMQAEGRMKEEAQKDKEKARMRFLDSLKDK